MVYFLYTSEYIDNAESWCQLLSDLPEGLDLVWEGGTPIFHARMYEVGERHGLSILQTRAFQCFVRLFATQSAKQPDTWTRTSRNILQPMTKVVEDSDTESEISDDASKDKSEQPIFVPSRGRHERANIDISAILADDCLLLMQPIKKVILHALHVFNIEDPSPILNTLYTKFQREYTFSKIVDINEDCSFCQSGMKRLVAACEHGWGCDEAICKRAWVDPSYCDMCLRFDDDE